MRIGTLQIFEHTLHHCTMEQRQTTSFKHEFDARPDGLTMNFQPKATVLELDTEYLGFSDIIYGRNCYSVLFAHSTTRNISFLITTWKAKMFMKS